MNLALKYLLILYYSFLLPSLVFALSTDTEQPIELQADTANIDESQGKSIYSGNVVLTQGSTVIHADRLTIYHPDKKIDYLVAEGKPATYEQLPDNKKEKVHAEALTMKWYEKKEEIHLLKDARLRRGKNTFEGHKIIYNTKKETMEAKGASKKERLKFTIQPNKKNTE